MELDLIFKIAAVGIIVAVLNQILKKTDHDEQAMMLTVAGLVIVLMMLKMQAILQATVRRERHFSRQSARACWNLMLSVLWAV